jgi:hypothetical protein
LRGIQAMAHKGIGSAANQTASTSRASNRRNRRAAGANPTNIPTDPARGDVVRQWGTQPADHVQNASVRVRRRKETVKRHVRTLEGSLTHMLKMMRSSAPGLFHCSPHLNTPDTQHGLKQRFGQHRSRERRTMGQKRGMPSTVLWGLASQITQVANQRRRLSSAAAGWRLAMSRPGARSPCSAGRFAIHAQEPRFRGTLRHPCAGTAFSLRSRRLFADPGAVVFYIRGASLVFIRTFMATF